MKAETFYILGEDKRLFYTAESLQSRGFQAKLYTALPDTWTADVLILPVPLSRDGTTVSTTAVSLEALADVVPSTCRIFCGMPGMTLRDCFYKKGHALFDYAAREEFAVRNAVPTAEGVVEILLKSLPITLRGAQIFVTGYGRTAKAIARLLTGMGAHITIAARRCSALAMANGDGYRSVYLRELSHCIGEADAVVNTVPANVLSEPVLSAMRRSCPIVEVASAPYGVDGNLAEQQGIQVIPAPALPGKVAPKTAGIIIADTVLNILREENE